jgi:hypothetical protein
MAKMTKYSYFSHFSYTIRDALMSKLFYLSVIILATIC